MDFVIRKVSALIKTYRIMQHVLLLLLLSFILVINYLSLAVA